MLRFIVIYRSPATEDVLLDDEARAKTDEEVHAWTAWAKVAGKRLIDHGSLLGNPHVVTHSGISAAVVAGSATAYSFLEAKDMEQATALMHKHPHLVRPGATIEVYEVLPWPEVG